MPATLFFVVGLVLLHTTASWATPIPTIYVAPNGNDNWSGMSPMYAGEMRAADGKALVHGPVRTIEAGLSAARKLYGPDVTKKVQVEPGYYPHLTQPLAISGLDNNTFIYAKDPAPGKTVITGGVYIPARAWRSANRSGMGYRIPDSVRPNVMQVDLFGPDVGLKPDQLIPLDTDQPGSELFFKGDSLNIARWPNKGEYVLCRNVSIGAPDDKYKVGYYQPKLWMYGGDYAGTWVHGFFGYDWFDDRRVIRNIDTWKQVLTLGSPVSWATKTGQRFYFYNIIDELDEAGEYFIDYTNGILYFYPPSPITSDGDAMLSVLNLGSGRAMIEVQSATKVTLSGFTIEGNRDSAVLIENGSHNTISKCTIRNVGAYGVSIQYGYNHLVMASEIYQTGTTAVGLLGAPEDRMSLTPSEHMAFANHVHNFARYIYCYQPAFLLSNVGCKVINNKIHTAPHNAILLVPGNDHEIYFNEIYEVCMETGDVGAFYQGRDWSSQGTFLSYNYFHDIYGYSDMVNAIYFDDENSGTTAFGNIVVNTVRGVLLGGGRSNKVNNNIFVNMSNARGLPGQVPQNEKTLMQRLNAMPYTSPPWSWQYPELVDILEDPLSPHAPRYNSFMYNVACYSEVLEHVLPAARPYIYNVSSDNWWPVPSNSTSCEKDVFAGDLSKGDITIRSDASFLKNITFSVIPTWRIGVENAFAKLPDYLPGLKYGRIITPSPEDIECIDEESCNLLSA